MAVQTALPYIQTGLYKSLTAHKPLMDRITGVYDAVAEDQVYPYVTLGEQNPSPFDTKTSTGEEIQWVLHCWSDYNGKKEAYEILNLMMQAFSQQPLSIGGGFSVVRFEKNESNHAQVITDIDGQTRHGILRVRIWVIQ